MSLKVDDDEGEETLILAKSDIAALIKDRQQELGYTTYLFTKIMKSILIESTMSLDGQERTKVNNTEDVTTQMTIARNAIEEAIRELSAEPLTLPAMSNATTNLKKHFLFEPPTGPPHPNPADAMTTDIPEITMQYFITLREELKISLTQIDEAPHIANTMRPKPRADITTQSKITDSFDKIREPIMDPVELRQALRRCQPGKCGGASGITREHLLHLPDSALEHFVPIINTIIDGSCANRFKLGVIVPLLKDERRYRPVTLLESLWKAAMTRISDRLLDTLQEHHLLHNSQYAFVRGGSTHQPLDLISHIIQRASAKGETAHICFLDATSAYDCVPLWALDVAFRRIGAPEEFINWVRKMTEGHHRIVSTCGGVTAMDDQFPLGGLAQGCPFSPVQWVVLADMPLSHAYNTPEHQDQDNPDPNHDGFTMAEAGTTPGRNGRISLKAVGYADDLLSAGKQNEEATKYAQAMVIMMGCLNIKVQGKKCINMRNQKSAIEDETCDLSTQQIENLGLTSQDGTLLIPRGSLKKTCEDLLPTCLLGHLAMVSIPTDPGRRMEGRVTEVSETEKATWIVKITLQTGITRALTPTQAARAVLCYERANIHLVAMDANGTLRRMVCTRVEPFPKPDGKTPEERGATRYLGTYVTFQEGWVEHKLKCIKDIQGLGRTITRMACPLPHVHAVAQSVLCAKLLNARLVMPNDKEITEIT